MAIWSKWLLYYGCISLLLYFTLLKQDVILMPIFVSILLLLFFAGPLLIGRWHFSNYRNLKRWRLPKKSFRAIWIFAFISLAMVVFLPTTLLVLMAISAIMILIVGIQLWVVHARFAKAPTLQHLKYLLYIRLKATLWWTWLALLLFSLVILLPLVFLVIWSGYI